MIVKLSARGSVTPALPAAGHDMLHRAGAAEGADPVPPLHELLHDAKHTAGPLARCVGHGHARFVPFQASSSDQGSVQRWTAYTSASLARISRWISCRTVRLLALAEMHLQTPIAYALSRMLQTSRRSASAARRQPRSTTPAARAGRPCGIKSSRGSRNTRPPAWPRRASSTAIRYARQRSHASSHSSDACCAGVLQRDRDPRRRPAARRYAWEAGRRADAAWRRTHQRNVASPIFP